MMSRAQENKVQTPAKHLGTYENGTNSPRIHDIYKYNYLYIDGHVSYLHQHTALGNGTPSAPEGSWTHITGD